MAADSVATAPLRALLDRHGTTLLTLAAASIRYPLIGRTLRVGPKDVDPELARPGASFVTLAREGELRGCVGAQRAWRPLLTDVIENAAASANADPRFPRLTAAELQGLSLAVSLLTAPEPLKVRSEADLIAQLRVDQDGIILSDGNRHGLFLPEMWQHLPSPTDFIARLKWKAGLPAEHWSPSLQVWRFETLSIKIDDIARVGDFDRPHNEE